MERNNELKLTERQEKELVVVPTLVLDPTTRTPDYHPRALYQVNISGVWKPDSYVSPTIYVPNGYAMYWEKTVNIGWSDNKPTPRPLEGFWFEHAGQWIYAAKRAQLCALTGTGLYVGYEPQFDRSRPEWSGKAIANDTGRDWVLNFYMNDDWRYYDDNAGSANCDIVVYRIGDKTPPPMEG